MPAPQNSTPGVRKTPTPTRAKSDSGERREPQSARHAEGALVEIPRIGATAAEGDDRRGGEGVDERFGRGGEIDEQDEFLGVVDDRGHDQARRRRPERRRDTGVLKRTPRCRRGTWAERCRAPCP